MCSSRTASSTSSTRCCCRADGTTRRHVGAANAHTCVDLAEARRGNAAGLRVGACSAKLTPDLIRVGTPRERDALYGVTLGKGYRPPVLSTAKCSSSISAGEVGSAKPADACRARASPLALYSLAMLTKR